MRANEEQSSRHTIDRWGVVSKDVGETEKRLKKIFLQVKPRNLMLLLDEADVLMRKRSMVKNARDAYGNTGREPSTRPLFETAF